MTSLSAGALNLTQVALVVFPKLTGKYGANKSMYNLVKSAKISAQAKAFNYSQVDPAISNIAFNKSGDTDKQTIGDSACGPMAAATAITKATGKFVNPVTMANDALPYKEKNGGTKFGYFKNQLNKFGLSSDLSTNKKDRFRGLFYYFRNHLLILSSE